MSFLSPQGLLTYQVPSNSQRPSLSSHISKNQSINQFSEKKSFITSSPEGISQNRKSNNFGYGKISNESYSGNSVKVGNTGNKLNEMSSDLAKLKQQLSKIMSQADKFGNRTNNQNRNDPMRVQSPVAKYQPKKMNNFQSFKSYQLSKPSKQIQQQQKQPTNQLLTSKSSQSYLTLSKQALINNINNKANLQPSNPKQNINSLMLNNQSYSERQKNQLNFNSFSNSKEDSYSLNGKRYYGLGNVNEQKRPMNNYLGNGREINYKKDEKQASKVLIEKQVQKQTDNGYKNEDLTVTSSINYSNSVELENNDHDKIQKPSQINTQQNPLINSHTPQKPPSNPFPTHNPQNSLDSRPISNTPSYLSKQLTLNQIMTEQLSTRIQIPTESQQLLKKKQQQQLQYQEKIIELQHQKRKLNLELNNVKLEKENIQLVLSSQKSQKQTLQKKYAQLQQLWTASKLELQELKTKNKLLEKKLATLQQQPKRTMAQPASFDQALKSHLLQISQYKQKLEEKDEQINKQKDISLSYRRQIDSINNQFKIQQLKAVSTVNQIQQKHSIQMQDKENQLRTYKNLVNTLQAKLSVAVKQNQSKDAFLVQHLTGKTKTQDEKKYVIDFLKKFEIEFPTNKFGQKILQEQIQIERLKKIIVQIAGEKKY